MRTTLDIEDEILRAIEELARRRGSTTGKVLSDLARRGLAASASDERSDSTMRAGVPVLPSRGELATLERIQRLGDEEGV